MVRVTVRVLVFKEIVCRVLSALRTLNLVASYDTLRMDGDVVQENRGLAKVRLKLLVGEAIDSICVVCMLGLQGTCSAYCPSKLIVSI